VRVRLVYDWMGGFGKASRAFWNHLREGGVEVRCYNPPRLESPFGWLSRDHRKMLAVDGRIGFVAGLCVGRMWVGDPSRKLDPWRDTGVELRGPAVEAVERAFAQVWAMMGTPLPEGELVAAAELAPDGEMSARVVATVPATAGMLRLDQLVAALAQERLWLTDAYFAGTTSYVQALRAAAKDGVDVRLLVPGGTDIPLLRPLSRAGYRPLLDAGVRVFEWNGTMLHAKTAVADARWARVGSTNLNIASWFGNSELELVVEDEGFACSMEEAYLADLGNATEVVAAPRLRRRAPRSGPRLRHPAATSGSSGVGRAAVGAMRVGNAVGAAVTNWRVLEPVEARIMAVVGATLLGLALLVWVYPKALAYPAAVLGAWIAFALLYRSFRLTRRKREPGREPTNGRVEGK
jgi:cardiolipin synthase